MMTPETAQELHRLMALPWTIVRETSPEGDRLLRVREIPSAVGHGETDDELERDLREALAASLSAYLHFGDPIPTPGEAVSPTATRRRRATRHPQ